MQVEDTAIPAVKIVTPKKHGDARGFSPRFTTVPTGTKRV
jgi:dTDP-4-dehydrorhamnose 3,5-epimerase-like enzyme